MNVLTATALFIFNMFNYMLHEFHLNQKNVFDSSQSNKALYRFLKVDGQFKAWGLLHKMNSNRTLKILDHELSGVGNLFESRS